MTSEDAYNHLFTLINSLCHNLEKLADVSIVKKITLDQKDEKIGSSFLLALHKQAISMNDKQMHVLNNLRLLKEGLQAMNDALKIASTHAKLSELQ